MYHSQTNIKIIIMNVLFNRTHITQPILKVRI